MCIGADYKKAMEPGLESKRQYAKKHGYDLHIGGEDIWDRTRPISWSKIKFIQKYLNQYDYIFWSDADVIILDQEKRLETQILPLLPPNKDMLWTFDACNHYNGGHLFVRGKSKWLEGFLNRVYSQTDLIHHIWWDTAALIQVYESNAEDKANIETCRDHWMFNSYIFGPNNLATDPSTRLYKPGDFLIHFAGVYDIWNIYRMMKYAKYQHSLSKPFDPTLLDTWRANPPKDRNQADESLRFLTS